MNEKETTERQFNVAQSISNQKKVWENAPKFAPSNGVCWKCHQQIYEPKDRVGHNGKAYISGIDVEQAKALVTGCPHCNWSYCD